MTLSLSDLITKRTRDEMYAELLQLCTSFSMAVTSWQEGARVRTVLAVVGQKLADFTSVNTEIAKGGYGDLVSDAWAPLWSKQTFDVDVVEAAPATGAVNFTNASGTQYDKAAGEVIVAHNTKGKTYRNQAPISILANSTLTGVAIQADEVGTGSDAAPGAITVMVTSLIGVTVTNPLAVLGADRETTPALVLRSRRKLGSLSPKGAKDAYNYIATTPEFSATSTPITRTRTVASVTTGIVSVYLATASGAPIAGDVTIVQAAIDKWAEPWTATATAVASTPHVIAVTYHVWIKDSDLTVAQIETTISDALTRFLATADLGGFVIPPDTGAIYVEEIDGVIRNALPGIVRVLVSVPAADVALTPNEVPTLGTVTATVTKL